FGVLLFGSLVLLPPFVQDMGGYSVLDSGWIMAPRGAGTMLASFLVGYLVKYVDPRKIIAIAMFVIAGTMWQLSRFTTDIDHTVITINNFIQGLAFGAFTVPLNSVAFTTLPPNLRDAGTSFYSLLNNIGRGFGVALFSTYFAVLSQTNHFHLSEIFHPENETLKHLHIPPSLSMHTMEGLAALERMVARQGKLLAYIGDFQLLAIIIAACIPILFFMSNPLKAKKA
ncbi:MAG: MFS transporter, partial [Hyphomicrobiaceae bacterium]